MYQIDALKIHKLVRIKIEHCLTLSIGDLLKKKRFNINAGKGLGGSHMKKLCGLIILLLLILTGCGGQGSNGNQMDYEQTKKMIVDILKSDDGKKAFEEIMTDEKMQQKLVMDQKIVSDTIVTTLTSEKGVDFWKESFSDPKFAESVAKSMKKENETLLKDLMKDPEYQAMMIDILKDPEIAKALEDQMKSQKFREHLQTVVLDTIESPLFKAKMADALMKAAEEMGTGKSGEESGGGGDSGGGDGGGGDQGGGGSGQGS